MKKILFLLAFTGCSPAYAQEAESPHQFFLNQQISPKPKAHSVREDRGPTKSVMSNYTHGAPRSSYVRGRLTCAINVNKALAAVGVEGTGSAKALDFLQWGRPTTRRPGAVQVSKRRGKGNGHVELVAENGQCWNPSVSQQRWVLVPCDSRRNVIGWRSA